MRELWIGAQMANATNGREGVGKLTTKSNEIEFRV